MGWAVGEGLKEQGMKISWKILPLFHRYKEVATRIIWIGTISSSLRIWKEMEKINHFSAIIVDDLDFLIPDLFLIELDNYFFSVKVQEPDRLLPKRYCAQSNYWRKLSKALCVNMEIRWHLLDMVKGQDLSQWLSENLNWRNGRISYSWKVSWKLI